jgi:predicted ATPase
MIEAAAMLSQLLDGAAGLFWLGSNLAARQPLLIVVNDAHWADEPSLRWLVHLGSRLDGLGILVLLAVRSGPDAHDVLLDELRATSIHETLRLSPLSLAATAALLRERPGDHLDPQVCHACHLATGGNPFLLEALLGALRSEALHSPGRLCRGWSSSARNIDARGQIGDALRQQP